MKEEYLLLMGSTVKEDLFFVGRIVKEDSLIGRIVKEYSLLVGRTMKEDFLLVGRIVKDNSLLVGWNHFDLISFCGTFCNNPIFHMSLLRPTYCGFQMVLVSMFCIGGFCPMVLMLP